MEKANKFFLIGSILLLAGVALFGKNIWEDRQINKKTEELKEKLDLEIKGADKSEISLKESYMGSKDIEDPEKEMPTLVVDGIEYIGYLIIPSANLELPVLNNWSYENLRLAPARFDGSVYLDNMTILAHNNRAHFWDLFYLEKGDLVIFKDIKNKEFDYRVEEIEELEPVQVEDMVFSDWDLTLFTCTLSQEARVTVRCSRIGKDKDGVIKQKLEAIESTE